MTQIDLVGILQRFARDHKKRVFSLREIATLAGVSRAAAGMTLIRAEKRGVVWRVLNLWINRLDPPELLEIALSLPSPSYLSFEGALYRHGLLSQSPRGALTLATTGRPRRIETPGGILQFIHLKNPLFFGFNAERIAFPEKAWLDLLYIRGRRGRKNPITETVYLDRLNKARLASFERRFPAWVSTLRRSL